MVVLLGIPTSGLRSSTTLGNELMYVAVPVLSGTDVLGVVRTFCAPIVEESGSPETRKLASSFNVMASRLVRMIDQ